MPDTLGSLKVRVLRELKETENLDLVTDRINDAIEDLWEGLLLVNLSEFVTGPVNSLSYDALAERNTIVSVIDPIAGPALGTTVLGALAAHTIYAVLTLVTESGSETLPSPETNRAILINNVASAAPPAAVAGAIGWNLYASTVNGGPKVKQNALPMDFSQVWQEPQDTGIIVGVDGVPPPTVNTTADDIAYIKLIEVQNTDGTYTRWQASDLESLMMSRAERNLPAATTYQSYAWDFINGNTVEIRPAAGMALNPRLFYVRKPRRLRFDSAPSPFIHQAATEFIINFTLSRLSLTNHEYQAHGLWKGLAAEKKQQILLVANQQNVKKQETITPFLR